MENLTTFTPAELSYLAWRHRILEPSPCRVCGAEMTVTSMGGGQPTQYACSSEAANWMGKTGAAGDESLEHWRRSKQAISYHGGSSVLRLIAELRALRAASGEDLTVPVGAVHFPDGHGPYVCCRYARHLGGGRWQACFDGEYSHDLSHATLDAYTDLGD